MSELQFYMPFNAKLDASLGIYDRRVFASEFAEYFAMFIGNGVYANPSTNFQVLAGGQMTLVVKKGACFINGRYGSNKQDQNVILSPADTTNPRYDRVCLRLNLEDRVIEIVVIEGEPNVNPILPSLIRYDSEESGNFYDLCIANILIGANASVIVQSNITDTRLDNNVCGVVTSLIEQVDATTIFEQYQSYLNVQMVLWDVTKAQQENDWNTQMQQQAADFTDASNIIFDNFNDWFVMVKQDIALLQNFDFDNLIYMIGNTYSAVKTDTGFLEEIEVTDTSENVATRTSTKTANGWDVVTEYPDLTLNTKISYEKDSNGKWTGVITNG